jgi:uncharacterized protein
MLFRLIFIGSLLYFVYVVVRFFQSIGRAARNGRPPAESRGKMVKDEVCDTYLPIEEAIREVRDGHEHYFCSDECRRKFLERANPAR